VDRREFLRAAGAIGGAALLRELTGCDRGGSERAAGRPPDNSILDHPVSECPIDTVVVVMMENRSFDHYLGWLADDEAYVEAGRRRYGRSFDVDGRLDQHFRDPDGRDVATAHLTDREEDANPFRGCRHTIPAHSWYTARLERDGGFLALGTDNDEYATGYYVARDLPFRAELARRFTVCDHHHASLLAGTFPNRQYFHAATSEGRKEDPAPLEVGLYTSETIWDRFARAGVPATYYYTDLPFLLLYGDRMDPYIESLDHYFEDAAAGTLSNVVVVDPAFGGHLRTDDHPRGDVRVGERFLLEVFAAFAQSPQWERGAFILCYDEWGGFFDHVPPPILPDDRASPVDEDNFGQAGFRVASTLASPYAHRGFVDHRVYDHTSILRFLEWRFLGAPPVGPGADTDTWFLTKRDRYAENFGTSLRPERPEVEIGIDVARLPPPSKACGADDGAAATTDGSRDPFENVSPALADLVGRAYPAPTLTPWLDKSKPRRL